MPLKHEFDVVGEAAAVSISQFLKLRLQVWIETHGKWDGFAHDPILYHEKRIASNDIVI